MKKLRCFLFCLMLSMQAAAGLFPVFRQEPKPPIQVMEENPCDDARKEN